MYEHEYLEGDLVKSDEWYESGGIKERKKSIVVGEYDYIFERWAENGTKIYYVNSKANETHAWYCTGEKKYDLSKTLSQYFDREGNLAFSHPDTHPHEDNYPFGKVKWNNTVLTICCAHMAEDSILSVFIWHWVESCLDESSEIGLLALSSLVESEVFSVKSRAVHLIGYRKIHELRPLIEKEIGNPMRRHEGDGGFIKSIGELAEDALSAL